LQDFTRFGFSQLLLIAGFCFYYIYFFVRLYQIPFYQIWFSVLQVVVDDVEAFRSKVNDAVSVIDNLDAYKETWLDQTNSLKAQTARSEFFFSF